MSSIPSALRRVVAYALESGAWQSNSAKRFAEVWARCSNPVRPLDLPAGVRVVGIGGATLGGSYKTPLVIALGRALAGRVPLAVVASSYTATPRYPSLVPEGATAKDVGDEAALISRELASLGIPVVLGLPRREALRVAGRMAPLLLVDGLLQASPRRVQCSLLVTDAGHPWGAGRCPPAGDLRASPAKLMQAADAVVLVGKGAELRAGTIPSYGGPIFRVESEITGARTAQGARIDLMTLRRARLGVLLAVARPQRILASLEAIGVRPALTHCAADHADPAPNRLWRASVDAWLASPKCATKLGKRLDSVPVWIIDHSLVVDPNLLDFVACGALSSATNPLATWPN